MMDYSTHYWTLIGRAQIRELSGYCERHHIVPKCMGGDNSIANLVDLTPEEHYVAHQLLAKMFPKVVALAKATALMAPQCVGNKAHGWIRRRAAIAVATINRMRKWSDASRIKVGRAGQSNPFFGKKHSIETRRKCADGARNQPKPQWADISRLKLSIRKSRLSSAQVDVVRSMREDGVILKDLALHFNVSIPTIYRAVTKVGVMYGR